MSRENKGNKKREEEHPKEENRGKEHFIGDPLDVQGGGQLKPPPDFGSNKDKKKPKKEKGGNGGQGPAKDQDEQ